MEYKNNRQRTAAHPSGPRKKYKKRRKNKYHRRLSFLKAGIIILLLCIGVVLFFILRPHGDSRWKVEAYEYDDHRPALDVQLLTPNEYSRPQTPLTSVNGIVFHYTANPGTDAQNNRDYFEGLKDSHLTYASSHFVVGLEGQIIQCIPTSEICYASNSRNSDTVAIEVCHPDESGKFTDETYDALVWLTGWLCTYLEVSPDQVIRHYDVTGKICPKYFVDHEDAWNDFKDDVKAWIRVNT